MSKKWIRAVTIYVNESEYQLITSKAEQLEVSSSSFAKQAVTTYIKHLEKHLIDAEYIAA